jgi:uncharacterized protein with PIN domain
MKFIIDRTLGKLAKWLRIMGYDTIFWRSNEVEGLLSRALEEERVLITKDTKLYKRRGELQAMLIREDNSFLQLQKVIRHFQLPVQEENLFTRCLMCNIQLEEIDAAEVKDDVPDYIFHTHREFSRCPSCGKVYWAGTHYEHMNEVVDRLKGKS